MLKVLNTIREEWREHWRPTRDRVLWAPVFVALGIGLYFTLMFEPSLVAGAICFGVCTVAALVATQKAPAWGYVALAAMLMALGFGAAQLRTYMADAPQLSREINFTRVEGRVQDITTADINPNTGRQRAKKVTLDSLIVEKLAPEATPRSIRLSTYHVPDGVVPGDRIALLAHLMPPSGPVAPNGFPYRRQAFFEGLGATGFTMGKFELIAKGDAPGNMWFNALRQKIATRISAHLPHPESAVVTALLAGERASIPESINNDLRDSGLYHLLSISGLHVAIVCGFTFFVLRFLMALVPLMALHLPIKKIAAAAALAVGFFYSMLAGMPVPTERALFMTGLALLAVMLDRTALSLRTIALAAFFILLIQPESLVGASFQLSFAAMLAMIAFYDSAGRKWTVSSREDSFIRKLFLYFAGIFITTILVSFATLPPILHHFGRFQIFGVIANAIAIPLTSFVVMPAGMAAMVLMPLGLEGVFLKICGWGVEATLQVAAWVAHLPHATSAWPNVPTGWYMASWLGFLIVCLWRGRLRWIGVPVMIASVALGIATGARPVAMIVDDGKALGVKGGDQIAYFGKAPSKFEKDNWMSVWGGVEVNNGKAVKDPLWQSGNVSVACDDWACRIAPANGMGLSVVRSATVMNEECNWAGMVVVLDKAVKDARQENCAAQMVSAWDIENAGGMAFYHMPDDTWRAQGFTPREERRPWTLRKQ